MSVEVTPNSTYTDNIGYRYHTPYTHGLTVIAGVGATDGGRVLASLACCLKVIHTAGAVGASVET